MDFPVKTGNPVQHTTACAIVPLFDGSPMPAVTRAFDKKSGGALAAHLRAGDIKGELGHAELLHRIPGITAKRVLVVGCGKRKKFDAKAFATATAAATRRLLTNSISDAITYITAESATDTDIGKAAQISVESARTAAYRFNELKSKPEPAIKLRRFGIAADKSDVAAARAGIALGKAIANGTDIARNLGNRPANICTPTHVAAMARELARTHDRLTTKVLGPAQIEKLRMGAFLSVTQGAKEPAQFIVMQYKGGARGDAPIALCGKGVTFDTGGISIKPSPKMDEMKFDMCGAAGVIGTMAAIGELQPKINVVALVPCCENMPGSNATRPGDIVTSMSGKTIEVLNTDAEGRLILCDAITYAQQEFDPACVVDVATLTGACVVALGGLYTGVFGNDVDLSGELVSAGKRALDNAWPMPSNSEYGDSLRSNFADFANVGAREGGASVAAAFLGKFVDEGRSWAHLDIAGVAWRADANKGATGRPVPLLVDFILHRAQA